MSNVVLQKPPLTTTEKTLLKSRVLSNYKIGIFHYLMSTETGSRPEGYEEGIELNDSSGCL